MQEEMMQILDQADCMIEAGYSQIHLAFFE
jgi:hypothetical protein